MLALFLLLGTAFSLHSHLIYPTIALLFVGLYGKNKALPILCLFAMGYLLAIYRAPPLILPQEKMTGTAHFCVSTLKVQQSPFQRSLVYQGNIKHFQADDGSNFYNLP